MKHTKLILFCSLMLSGCQEVILHELNEGQANRALVILAREGLPAEKLREGAGWSIAVAKDKVTASLDVLEESRGLKELTERQSSSNSSLVQSREERQQQVEKELAERLEQTLESFPDVLEARVHLNLQSAKLSSLIAEKPKQSASVLILGRQGSVIEIAPIQRLISGASGVIDSAVTVLVKENKQNSSVQSRKVTPEQNVSVVLRHQAVFIWAGALALLVLSFLICLRRRQRVPRDSSSKPFLESQNTPKTKPLAPAFGTKVMKSENRSVQ